MRQITLILLALILTACGGDGGGSAASVSDLSSTTGSSASVPNLDGTYLVQQVYCGATNMQTPDVKFVVSGGTVTGWNLTAACGSVDVPLRAYSLVYDSSSFAQTATADYTYPSAQNCGSPVVSAVPSGGTDSFTYTLSGSLLTLTTTQTCDSNGNHQVRTYAKQ